MRRNRKQEDGTLVQMNVERSRRSAEERSEPGKRLPFSNFKYALNEQLIIHSLLINVAIIFSFIFVMKITKRGHQDFPQLSIIMNIN